MKFTIPLIFILLPLLTVSGQSLDESSFYQNNLIVMEPLPLGLLTLEFQGIRYKNYVSLPEPIRHELRSTPGASEFYRSYRNKRATANVFYAAGVASVTALGIYWTQEMSNATRFEEGMIDFMSYFFTALLAGGLTFGGGILFTSNSRYDLNQAIHQYNRYQLEHYHD